MYKKILICVLCLCLVGCGAQENVNTEMGTDVILDMPNISDFDTMVTSIETIDTSAGNGDTGMETEMSEETELGVIPEVTTVATVYIPEQPVEETTTVVETEKVESVSSVETTVFEQETTFDIDTDIDTKTEIEQVEEAPVIGTAEGVKRLTGYLLNSTGSMDSAMVSGYSTYSALMYVYPYTKGNTKVEFENILGSVDVQAFRAEQQANIIPYHGSTSYFDELLSFGDSEAEYALETSGLFLIDDNTVLNTEDTSNFVFKDLTDEGIVEYVNKFVTDKTHNMIREMINKPFDTMTRAVILDVLYFKDSWCSPFESLATTKEPFYGKTSETEVDMMHQTGTFEVYDNIIRLKYANTPVVMEIVKDISDVDSAYQYYCSNYSKVAACNNVRLSLPKFEMELELNLNNALKAAGITELYDEGKADISLLADNLYVSDIIQKTKISLDEQGTEASAVTMVISKDTAFMPEEVQYVDFIVNRPFMFVLRNTNTDELLFTGYFNNMN